MHREAAVPPWERVAFGFGDGDPSISFGGYAGARPWWDASVPFLCRVDLNENGAEHTLELRLDAEERGGLAAVLLAGMVGDEMSWAGGDQSEQLELDTEAQRLRVRYRRWRGGLRPGSLPTEALALLDRATDEQLGAHARVVRRAAAAFRKLGGRAQLDVEARLDVSLAGDPAAVVRLLLADPRKELRRLGEPFAEPDTKLSPRTVETLADAAARRWSWRALADGARTLAAEELAVDVLAPLYDDGKLNALEPLVPLRKRVPLVAAAFAQLAVERELDPLTIATGEEIVASAVEFLDGSYDRVRGWGWGVLWYPPDEMDPESYFHLVIALAELAPDDDEMLWMIADGPWAHLRGIPGMEERILELEQASGRLRRIRELAAERP